MLKIQKAKKIIITVNSDFSQTPKQIYRNSNMERKYSQGFKARLAVPEKWFSIRPVNFGFLSFLPTFNQSEDLIYVFYKFKTNL